MKTFLKSFFRDESGASAAEYALILAIVGVALGAAALALSLQISGAMNQAATEIGKGCEGGDCSEVTAPGGDNGG